MTNATCHAVTNAVTNAVTPPVTNAVTNAALFPTRPIRDLRRAYSPQLRPTPMGKSLVLNPQKLQTEPRTNPAVIITIERR